MIYGLSSVAIHVPSVTHHVPSSPKTKNKTRVRFGHVETAIVEDAASQCHDKSDLWFDQTEQDSFKKRDWKMGQLLQRHDMTASELEIKSGESSRGMEHLVDKHFGNAIIQRRRRAIFAVLYAQRLFRQSQINEDDTAEAISREYRFVCQRATLDAIERAKEDELFVQDHVRCLTNIRINETRSKRPSLLVRQPARRSLVKTMMAISGCTAASV